MRKNHAQKKRSALKQSMMNRTALDPFSRMLIVTLGSVALILIAILLVINAKSKRRDESLSQARQQAIRLLPPEAKIQEELEQGDQYVFKAEDAITGIVHEIALDQGDTNRWVHRLWDTDAKPSQDILMEQSDVEAIVRKHYPDAKIVQVRLSEQTLDPGTYYYRIQFIDGDLQGEFAIDPKNGQILEAMLRNGDAVSTLKVSDEERARLLLGLDALQEGNDASRYLLLDEVRALIHASWPKAKIQNLHYEEHAGNLVVVSELLQDGHQLNLMIDATEGTILNPDGVLWIPIDAQEPQTDVVTLTQTTSQISTDTSPTSLSSEPTTTSSTTTSSTTASSSETTETPPTTQTTTTTVEPTPVTTTTTTAKPTPVTTTTTSTTTTTTTTTTTAKPTPVPPTTTTTTTTTTAKPTPVPTTPKSTAKPTAVPTQAPKPTLISETRARQIAMAKDDDITIQSITLKTAGSIVFYSGVAYEDDDEKIIFEINAHSGYITKWVEIELDDNDSDDDDD